jgi:hypothetical protein
MMWRGLAVGDWAAWAQAVAILVTGFLAVFVASRQLSAFNKNERLQNSMKIVDDMLRVNELQGVRASPFDTCVEIDAISKNPDLTSSYRKMVENEAAFSNSASTTQEWFLATRSKAAIVVSYYLDLTNLLSLRLVDPSLLCQK